MFEKQFEKAIERFEKHPDIQIHAFAMADKDKKTIHFFQEETKKDVRSISKTVLALLAGIVHQDDPNFNRKTKIYPIIAPHIDLKRSENLPYLKAMRVEDLLSHRMGYDEVLLMRKDIQDIDPYAYLDLIVNHPIVYPPGEHYLYSNAGYYMLGVVLQAYLKEDLLAYADRKLFKPLGIVDYDWEYYGDYLAGATRLWLNMGDLLKIGDLLLGEGCYQGQRLISKEWFQMMLEISAKTPHVDVPSRHFRRYAYGHGLWRAKDPNIFFAHGSAGQTLTILKQEKIILATQAMEKNLYKLEGMIDAVIKDIV